MGKLAEESERGGFDARIKSARIVPGVCVMADSQAEDVNGEHGSEP